MNYQLIPGDCLDVMSVLAEQGVKVDATIIGDQGSRSTLATCGMYGKDKQG